MLFNYLTPGSEIETRPRFGFVFYFQTIHTHLMVSHSLHSQASNGLLTSLSNLLPHFSFTTFSNPITSPNKLVIPLSLPSKLLVSHQLIPIKSAAFLTSPCRLWSHPLNCLTRLASHSHLKFLITHRLLSFEFAALLTFPLQALVQPSQRFLTLSPSQASAALQPQIKLPHKASRSCVFSVSS